MTKTVVVHKTEFDYETLNEILYNMLYCLAEKSGKYCSWQELSDELKQVYLESTKYLVSLVGRREKSDLVIYHCYVDFLNKEFVKIGWKFDQKSDHMAKTNPDMVNYDSLNPIVKLGIRNICDVAWNIVNALPKEVIETLKGLYL